MRIEIKVRRSQKDDWSITPFTGVRIKIGFIANNFQTKLITPFTGVRIEIIGLPLVCPLNQITPFTDVRIEMKTYRTKK